SRNLTRFEQPSTRHCKCHVRPGYRSCACASVCLQYIAVDRHRTLAECFHVSDCSQASTNQTLDFVSATRWSTATSFTRSSSLRRSGQHRVLCRQPALTSVSQKRWHAVFKRG